MKLGQNVCQTNMKMDHVRSKTRSLAKILGKPCVHYRGQIFSQIIMKLGQNVVLMKSWTSSKWVMSGKKLRHILQKPCVDSRGHIFSLIHHETWSECLS